ncbi:MAG: CHAT domain-containing tetratricopeptide repeat protein [Acidobacteriota bacterium]|nr:CHAT domain-containing tetratricopeptide repeat protein [Acidobacteriota bacterium]
MRRAAGLVVVCGLLLLLQGGCGSPPADAPPVDLEACPPGDEPWRAALERADNQAALEALAVRLEAVDPRCGKPWQTAWIEGRLCTERGEIEPARARLLVALERARAAGDPVGTARAGDDLAWLEYRSGRLVEAERLYRQALDAAIAAERDDLQAFLRNNLVPVLLDRGKVGEAVELFARVPGELEALGLAGAARGAAYNQAVLLIQLGDVHGGRPLLEAIHQRSVEQGDDWTAAATAVVLGNLHRALGQPAVSMQWLQQVDDGEPELVARARLGLARLALARGAAAHARALAEEAVGLARGRDEPLARLARAFAAAAQVAAGDATGGLRRLEALNREGDTAAQGGDAWVGWWLEGRARMALGQGAVAREALERAVSLLEGQRGSLEPGGAGLRFLRERFEPWADLALAWMGEGESTAAAGPVEAVYGLLQRQGRSRTPGLPPGELLAGLQRRLAPDEVVVAYLLGEDSGVALVVRRGEAELVRVGGHAAVRTRVEAFRAALAAGGGAAQGAELSRLLLEPLGRHLAACRRLMIVPDRELALLPFGALPLPGAMDGEPLGLRLELSLLPVLGDPPRTAPRPAPVLLAGRSRFEGSGRPDLPWAAWELSRLAGLWGGRAQLLVEQELTLERLFALPVENFRTLHFATHATASTRNPRRCGIILGDDQRLGLEEIRKLHLADALVVLSACRTGEGEVIPGEGVVGLGRAFLDAGARGVLVSLWPVADRSTARLMVAFHRALAAGATPPRALLEARRELSRSHRGAARRSPFVLLEGRGAAAR